MTGDDTHVFGAVVAAKLLDIHGDKELVLDEQHAGGVE
jgi:hypothetical protein